MGDLTTKETNVREIQEHAIERVVTKIPQIIDEKQLRTPLDLVWKVQEEFEQELPAYKNGFRNYELFDVQNMIQVYDDARRVEHERKKTNLEGQISNYIGKVQGQIKSQKKFDELKQAKIKSQAQASLKMYKLKKNRELIQSKLKQYD